MLMKRGESLAELLIPVRWGELAIVMLCNVFPLVAIFYLMIWGGSSMPLVTRLLFVMMVAVWLRELTFSAILSTRILLSDYAMVVFFSLALIGYARSGFTGVGYFLTMNMMVFFIGRYAIVKNCNSLIAYFFSFASLVALACIVALPEIYHQWNSVGATHPVLYGFIPTACGLDVSLGYLPLLSGVLVLFATPKQSKAVTYLLYACVAIGVILLILVASKSVIFATDTTLIVIMGIQFRRWKKSISLVMVLFISSIIAISIAPSYNQQFYLRNSFSKWSATLHQEERARQAAESVVAPVADLEPVPDTGAESVVAPAADLEPVSDTGAERIHLAAGAINTITHHPVFGIGAQTWTYDAPHPHNVILESALTFGLPATLALLLFNTVSIWRLIFTNKVMTDAEQKKYVLVGGMLLFMFVYNLVQGQLASLRSLPLFLLGGYACAMIADRRVKFDSAIMVNK